MNAKVIVVEARDVRFLPWPSSLPLDTDLSAACWRPHALHPSWYDSFLSDLRVLLELISGSQTTTGSTWAASGSVAPTISSGMYSVRGSLSPLSPGCSALLKELKIELFPQFDEGKHVLEIQGTTRNYSGSMLVVSLCFSLLPR